jgi:cystathionine beta-lyase/cystathionine gamma-synthase
VTTTATPYGQDNFGFSTEQIHAGEAIDGNFGARITPIYLTAGFLFDSFDHAQTRFAGEDGGLVYSRYANPTNSAVEAKLTALERGAGRNHRRTARYPSGGRPLPRDTEPLRGLQDALPRKLRAPRHRG